MSLEANRYRLWTGYQTLKGAWEYALRHWKDQVRREFDRDFWSNLEPRISHAVTSIDQLSQVVAQAKQDCGEEPA